MKFLLPPVSILLLVALQTACEGEKDSLDYSGVYCLNIQNLEMTIEHHNNGITFTLQNDLLVNGTGTLLGDTLVLTAFTAEADHFISKLIFAGDRQSFGSVSGKRYQRQHQILRRVTGNKRVLQRI